jgi:hypothetical protein
VASGVKVEADDAAKPHGEFDALEDQRDYALTALTQAHRLREHCLFQTVIAGDRPRAQDEAALFSASFHL